MILLASILDLPLVDILGLGTIGLGFLLALLSFRLLGKEQKRNKVRQPMLYAIYAFMVFSLGLCVFGFFSQPVPGDKTEPDTGSHNADTPEINRLQAELDACQKRSPGLLNPADFTHLSEAHFPSDSPKDSILREVRRLIAHEKMTAGYKDDFGYTLFELEKKMEGRNVNLRLDHGSNKETILLIQKALQGLERYKGPINGDRVETYAAVVRFQQWLNQANGTETAPYIKPMNYGIFGYRTLEAIRTQYRLRADVG